MKSKPLRVLIGCNWSFDWPYVPELAEWNLRQGNLVDVLDSRRGTISTISLEDLRSYQPSAVSSVPPESLLAKVRRRLRTLAKTATTLRRMARYDVVNIHFLSLWACVVARLVRARSGGTVLTVWGSDFYRSTDRNRAIFRRVMGSFDVINFGNPVTSEDFSRVFPMAAKRLRICSFGIGKLDLIDSIAGKETPAQIRSRLDIPGDAIVVCCGYNGVRAQNHFRMIEAAAQVSASGRARCLFVFPMSYGGTSEYRAEVKDRLALAGVPHRVIEGFHTDADVARWRMAANVLVTIQETDQLSATVQEHLYCGAVLVAGDWLPYGILDQWKAPMIRTTIESLPSAIEHAILRAGGGPPNPEVKEKVRAASGWSSAIERWEGIYREAMEARWTDRRSEQWRR